MARSRQHQPEFEWPFSLDPGRELEAWYSSTPFAFRIACYRDEPLEEFGGGRYAIPREFFALWRRGPRQVALKLRVEHGTLVCDQVAVIRSEDGPPLTSTDLRVPLGELVKASGGRAGGLIVPGEETESGTRPAVMRPMVLAAKTTDEYDDYTDALVGETRVPLRGKRMTDEEVRRVADVYRAALASGDSPTQAVADKLNAARSTAGRWVMEARKRGLLGPATPGRAGEQTKGETHGSDR